MSIAGMRGPSAEALATLADRVGEVGRDDASRVGEDLFGVAAVLRGEPGLRRIATDAAIDDNARGDLVRGIFEGKVTDQALEVVVDAAHRRWTSTRDLADSLENLGVRAVVASAGEHGSQLADELFVVGRLVNSNDDLRSALSDPARSNEDKSELLHRLLEGKTLPATMRLAQQSVGGSYHTPSAAIIDYQKIAAAVHDEGVARVRVARELSANELQRLHEALRKQYGHQVHLNVVVEPELMGGMRVEIGDDVIDGTVSGRIDEARRRMTA